MKKIIFTGNGTVKGDLYKELPTDVFLKKFEKDMTKGKFSNAFIDEENLERASFCLAKDKSEFNLVINEEAEFDLKNGLATENTEGIYYFLKLLREQMSLDRRETIKAEVKRQAPSLIRKEENGNLTELQDKLLYMKYLIEKLNPFYSRKEIRENFIENADGIMVGIRVFGIFNLIASGLLANNVVPLLGTTFATVSSTLAFVGAGVFALSPAVRFFGKKILSALKDRKIIQYKIEYFKSELLGESETKKIELGGIGENLDGIGLEFKKVKNLVSSIKSREKLELLERLDNATSKYLDFLYNLSSSGCLSSIKEETIVELRSIEEKAKSIKEAEHILARATALLYSIPTKGCAKTLRK